MKKLLIAIWILTSIVTSTFAADICQWNICIDVNGNIYIKNNETIYSSLLEWVGTGSFITSWTINTGSVNSWTTITSTGTLWTWIVANTWTTATTPISTIFKTPNEELNAAILRWYTNDLTIYNNITDYQANNLLLREQAAKLFYQTALIVEYNWETYNDCTFSDITSVSESLKENIKNACNLWWLMKGNKWLFTPTNNLSYAEAITVIARIADIENTTTQYARRTPYLTYVKNLGILKGTNINESTMENKITRWELIVLLYRLSVVYENNGGNLSDIANTTITTPSIELPSDTNSSNSLVSIGAWVIDTPKFTTALLWMYHSNMTVYWKASDYDPFNILTREQAAKLLSIYNKKFKNNTGTVTSVSCNYTDIKDSWLQDYIIDACQKWIFKNSSTFNPSNAIIKSEFVTAILNMLHEKPWSGQNIPAKALELEIISKADLNTFDKPITRYEVALLLSNLHLQTEFINNLKDIAVTYNVIAPIEKDTTVYPAWQQKVFIDINSIDSKEFNNGFINLFGKSYKITKKEIINYLPTSYSRYGEITDITNDNEIGNISMAIGQKWGTKILIEWFIVFPDIKEILSIYPTTQIPYYMITKIK
jgi:hypothetical protein